MTAINSDQAHLDSIVTAESEALATIVAELKAANVAGTPLNFTAADAFVAAAQAQALADAPVAPGTTATAPLP